MQFLTQRVVDRRPDTAAVQSELVVAQTALQAAQQEVARSQQRLVDYTALTNGALDTATVELSTAQTERDTAISERVGRRAWHSTALCRAVGGHAD